MSNDKTIDGTAPGDPRAGRPAPAGPRRIAIPRRTWVVGAVAAPLCSAPWACPWHRGTTFQPTPVAPVAIQALAPSGGDRRQGRGRRDLRQQVRGPGRHRPGAGRDRPRGRGRRPRRQGRGRDRPGPVRAGLPARQRPDPRRRRKVLLGPAGGPPTGSLDWAKDRIGLGPKPDLAGPDRLGPGGRLQRRARHRPRPAPPRGRRQGPGRARAPAPCRLRRAGPRAAGARAARRCDPAPAAGRACNPSRPAASSCHRNRQEVRDRGADETDA